MSAIIWNLLKLTDHKFGFQVLVPFNNLRSFEVFKYLEFTKKSAYIWNLLRLTDHKFGFQELVPFDNLRSFEVCKYLEFTKTV